MAVHHRAADQDEQRARHAHHRQHQAQGQRVGADAQHQPGQGDQRELVAERRDQRAAQQPANVGVGQQGGVAGCG
jgi:hypothetical protein